MSQSPAKTQANGIASHFFNKAQSAPEVPPRRESLNVGNPANGNDRKLSFGGVISKKRLDSKASGQSEQSSMEKQDGMTGSTGSPDHSDSTATLPVAVQLPSSEYGRKERSKSQGRLSQIFPYPFKTCDRLEMLDRLTYFQEQSLLTASTLMQNETDVDFDEKTFYIEEKWQEIVKNSDTLSRKQQEQQEVLWELISTELNYIKKLCSVVELQNNVQNLQTEGMLQDVECEHVFGNILDIARSNLRFWSKCLRPLLVGSRDTGRPLDPIRLEVGFENVHKLFDPYVVYCLRHVDTLCYVRKKQKECELFKEFTTWVQSRRFFGRLHLTDLLAKPMQRLTKYPLLLKAILKCTVDQISRESLCRMIDVTEEFASKVNIELWRKQHFDALVCIMQCIDSYEAVETTNDELEKLVKECSYFDLTAPMPGCKPKLMRQLILRGELKFREAYSKVDVVCFLFTDMFMICKSLSKKGEKHRLRVIRPFYHLDKIIVKPLKDTVGFAFLCLNEFHVPFAASIFLTHSQDETTKWLEHIHIAKEEYCRLRNCDDYLSAMKCTTGTGQHKFSLESTFSPCMALGVGMSTAAPSSRKSSASGLLPPVFDANGDVAIGLTSSSTTLSSSGSTATKNRSGSPLRRISMGAADNGPRKIVEMIDHRKCSSIDSGNLNLNSNRKLSGSVLCAASLGMYSLGPLHFGEAQSSGSDPSAAHSLAPSPLRRAPSPLLEVSTPADSAHLTATSKNLPLKDSHSSSCLVDHNIGDQSASSVFLEDAEMSLLRLKANSMELIKRLSPSIKRKSWQATSNEQLEIIQTPEISEQTKKAGSNEEEPGQTDSLEENEPVFMSQNDGEKHDDCGATPTHALLSNQASRRLERRYHTADAIEDLKPPSEDGAGVGAILKRFSWNTPTTAAQRRSKNTIAADVNARILAATLTSARAAVGGGMGGSMHSSYCSSSSGVSSGSLTGRCSDPCDGVIDSTGFSVEKTSFDTLRKKNDENDRKRSILPRLNYSESNRENSSRSESNGGLQHVSKITIESDWPDNEKTLTNQKLEAVNSDDKKSCDEAEEEGLIMEAHGMVKPPDFLSPKSKLSAKQKSNAKEDLLRFIMESSLESSDV